MFFSAHPIFHIRLHYCGSIQAANKKLPLQFGRDEFGDPIPKSKLLLYFSCFSGVPRFPHVQCSDVFEFIGDNMQLFCFRQKLCHQAR